VPSSGRQGASGAVVAWEMVWGGGVIKERSTVRKSSGRGKNTILNIKRR